MRRVLEILVAHINLWPGWGLYWKTCLYLLSQDRILSSGVCHIGQHMSQFITWRIWPHGNQCMVHHMGCTKNIDLMKAQYIYGEGPTQSETKAQAMLLILWHSSHELENVPKILRWKQCFCCCFDICMFTKQTIFSNDVCHVYNVKDST